MSDPYYTGRHTPRRPHGGGRRQDPLDRALYDEVPPGGSYYAPTTRSPDPASSYTPPVMSTEEAEIRGLYGGWDLDQLPRALVRLYRPTGDVFPTHNPESTRRFDVVEGIARDIERSSATRDRARHNQDSFGFDGPRRTTTDTARDLGGRQGLESPTRRHGAASEREERSYSPQNGIRTGERSGGSFLDRMDRLRDAREGEDLLTSREERHRRTDDRYRPRDRSGESDRSFSDRRDGRP